MDTYNELKIQTLLALLRANLIDCLSFSISCSRFIDITSSSGTSELSRVVFSSILSIMIWVSKAVNGNRDS